jgi:metal iron transporter
VKAPLIGHAHPGCVDFSITPSIIIAAAVGPGGLTAALNGTQVALSVILPFVSAPLIYFTCRNKYMTVSTVDGDSVKMRNIGLRPLLLC